MFQLRNQINQNFKIATELVSKLAVYSSIELTEDEKRLVTLATVKVADQLAKENVSISGLFQIAMLFSANGSIDLEYLSQQNKEANTINLSFGVYLNIITIAVDSIRKVYGHNNYEIFFELVILEELCHALWRILDEVEVKRKVWEVYYIYTEKPMSFNQFFSLIYTPTGEFRQFFDK